MEEQFIPYEEAYELRKLGFDEPSIATYGTLFNNKWELTINSDYYIHHKYHESVKACTAPLYRQAFRWIREEHNLTSHIHWTVGGLWDFTIEKSVPRGLLDMTPTRYRVDIESYEEAELACLRKLIEIIKKK